MLTYLFHNHTFSWLLMKYLFIVTKCPPSLTWPSRAQRPFAELVPASAPFPTVSFSCPRRAGVSPSPLHSAVPFILSPLTCKRLYIHVSPQVADLDLARFSPFSHLCCFPFFNVLFPLGLISFIFPHFIALLRVGSFRGFLGEHRFFFAVMGGNSGHALTSPSSGF